MLHLPPDMKYTVKCNSCNRSFVAEAQKFGRMKYRCPYCGNVMTCQFDPPQGLVYPRSIIPLNDPEQKSLAESSPMAIVKDRHDAQLTGFLARTDSRIQAFRNKYDDADLWLFFAFCVLFIICVICGLYICAEVAKLIGAGHSFVYSHWIELRNSI